MAEPTRAQMKEWLTKQKRWVDPEHPTRTPQNAAHNALIDAIVAALGSTEDLCDDGGCREHAYQEYLRGKAEGQRETGEPVRWYVEDARGKFTSQAPYKHRHSAEAACAEFNASTALGSYKPYRVVPLYRAAAPRPTETQPTPERT